MNSFKTDFRFKVRQPVLLIALLYPVIAILLLKLAFQPVSDLIFLKTGSRLEPYYIIIAVTLVSAIPALLGFIHAFIYLDWSDGQRIDIIKVTPADNKSMLYFRLLVPALISFFIVVITTVLTDPVPSEGWLRSVFVSLLLSIQAPFVFLYIVSFANSRVYSIVFILLYGILLATVPLGLLLHHPWNYFIFFSPLYWISWAWVSYNPLESFLYGAISTAISLGSVFWIYSHLIKKNKT